MLALVLLGCLDGLRGRVRLIAVAALLLTGPALIALIKAGNGIGIPFLVHCWLHT